MSKQPPANAPMHEYLTTKELAELLRIKERKVYDLAASGEVPCTKAMGKLLFPRGEVEAWLAAHSSGAHAGAVSAAKPAPMVFLGSHDPVLEWALREAQSGIAAYFDSSADGLMRMLAGEGVATGLHLYDPEADEWNRSVVARECAERPFALIAWARRRRGLIYSEDLDRRLKALEDIRGLRFAARQPEAGSQRIFEHLAQKAGLGGDDYELATVARSEADAALAVLEGRVDVCFGLEALARQYRLQFASIIEEEFDLLVDRRAWFEPPLQAFAAFWRSEAFRRQAEGAAGYNFSQLGQVRWNGA